MTKPSDILALIELMAEITDRSSEDCLRNLVAFEAELKQKVQPETTFDMYRFRKFLQGAKPGTQLTAREVCANLHMAMPPGGKGPAYAMKDEGWTNSGEKRGGLRLWTKPQTPADAP